MIRFILSFALLLLAPATGWACSSCGCTLSSDWEETSQTGIKLDLRYDYVNQTQLRAGTGRISGPEASQRTGTGGDPQEVEKYTDNRYVTLSGEYSFNPSWKLSLQIPYVIRHHSTLGEGSNGADNGDDSYTSNTSNLGDVRLFGRFQGFSEEHNLGVVLGLKLPTGSHTVTGTSTDPASPGPAEIDRGLQPGTGTTDLIVGAYYTRALDKNWDYFGEVLYQIAFNEVDHYRPGNGLNLNGGFRYMGVDWLMPQVQVNARYVDHDTGEASDTISTGGTLVYLSPGLTVPIETRMQVYGFVQVPIYQNVLGVQLVPTYTASLGARYTF